ncbi:MAG: methyltransferase domain-containing protein [Sulfuricellaceae bacterium]
MPNLTEWLTTPLGQYLIQREQAYFDREVEDIFGFNAVQLGLPQYDLLRNNRMPLRLCADRESSTKLRAAPDFLPVASQSIDLVLLPHILEFSDHPHRILRETERILMPEGQLIISGFNPFSLWGMARHLPGFRDALPCNRKFISLLRIKDWLELLGLEVVAGRMCCYAPPVQREVWLQRLRFMEAAGDRWWALAGGVYFLRARKRVHGMRLITPTWHELRAARKALKPVAQKLINRNEQ